MASPPVGAGGLQLPGLLLTRGFCLLPPSCCHDEMGMASGLHLSGSITVPLQATFLEQPICCLGGPCHSKSLRIPGPRKTPETAAELSKCQQEVRLDLGCDRILTPPFDL